MMKAAKLFSRVLSWLVKLEIAASIIALVAICGITLFSIAVRELGGSALWAEEVSLLMMKIVVFQGAAGLYAQRAYIVVGGLVAILPPRMRWAVSLAGWVLIGLFAALVAYQGLETYPTQIAMRSYLLELPKFYFTVPLILGAATIGMVSVYYFAATWLKGPPTGDAEIDVHIRTLPGLGDLS